MYSNFALKSLNASSNFFFLIFLMERCQTRSEHGQNDLTALKFSVFSYYIIFAFLSEETTHRHIMSLVSSKIHELW